MNYKVIRTKRKTLAISIVDGKIIVRAPLFLTDDIIHDFVSSKKDWIQKKQAAYRPVGIDLKEKVIRYFGKDLSLVMIKGSQFKISVEEQMVVHYPITMSEAQCIKRIEEYLKNQLYGIIFDYVKVYAKLLNIKTPPFKIRRYKRIHGRCNSRGELAFNLYLFHESKAFIRYVVLHECAHILEFNHSRKFYQIIEKYMPDYKQIIAEQKKP